jgi:drug/metabolite transporter (DMT)-like permease
MSAVSCLEWFGMAFYAQRISHYDSEVIPLFRVPVMNPTQRTGVLLVLIAAAGYAFLPIFAKFAYDAGMTALDVVTWRFIFATPGIWLVASRFPDSGVKKLPWRALLSIGMLFALIAMMAFFALERVPVSTFIVLVYLSPAFVAVLSLFNGEYLSRIGWLALGLTLVGVALTVPDFASGFSESDPFGVLLSIGNAAAYSVYIVISSRLLRGQTALAQASALSITGSLIVLGTLALFNGLMIPPTPTAWLCVIGIGMFSTVVAIFAFYAGMHRLGAPRASILGMVELVMTLTLSYFLLGETMLPIQIAGGGLILASAILLQVMGRTPIPEPNSEVLLPLEDGLQPEQSAV